MSLVVAFGELLDLFSVGVGIAIGLSVCAAVWYVTEPPPPPWWRKRR